MERRSFLRSAILAAGFITVAPHLAFPKRLHEDEIEWFVHHHYDKDFFGEILSVRAIYKEEEWNSDPVLCKSESKKINQCISFCKKAIIREIERHYNIPRGT